jgi:hypothetical protein
MFLKVISRISGFRIIATIASLEMHPEHKIQFDPRKFVVVPEFSAEAFKAFKELQHTDSSSVGMAMQ